jgi:hypothetical protein
MRGLRTLMLILLAAVFAVGGPLRALPCHAETAPPPCHEMAAAAADMSGMAHDKARKSKPDALAMSCCAGCLPAAVRDIAPAASPGAASASPSLRQPGLGRPEPRPGPRPSQTPRLKPSARTPRGSFSSLLQKGRSR